MNFRRTQIVRRLRLPGRTVRSRLTWLYGSLFLASGAAVLAVTGVLWRRATDAKTVVNGSPASQRILTIAGGGAAHSGEVSGGLVAAGGPFQVNRGATFVAVSKAHQVRTQLQALATDQKSWDLHQLLLYSGIALAIMAFVSIGLGWIVAGRSLRPLRTITSTAREISATNLHERLELEGPDDELKELGNTFDQLLGRLERSFESQRRFVANASHELRTPLATMRASLDVAEAKPEPIPAETKVLARRLRRELDRVDGLLESFLTLARGETGADTETDVVFDELVGASLEEHLGAMSAMDVELRSVDVEPAMVRGNAALLARLVDNLVDNAVRHNEPGGWVAVSVKVDGEMVTMVVENAGRVLQPTSVSDLVKPFHRLGADRVSGDGGYGLGLSIVESIVDAHRGRLEVSALPAGGLRAVVELPFVAHLETLAAMAASPS